MNEIVGQLSNREIALLVWLAIFLVAIIAYRPTRQSLGPFIRLIFFSKISLVLFAMLAYVTFIVVIFYWLHLSHWWMLKDALFWLFGTAIILLFNTDKATEEDHYIRKIALDNLKFAVVLDFVINLYVFDLAVELVLLPFLAALAMLSVVAATKDEYKLVKRLINWVTAAIGFGFVLYAVISVLANPRSFATVKNLEDFLTPIVLTLTFLPFIYAVALYSAYERLFTRVSFRLYDNNELLTHAKRQIISACRLRLSKVNRFAEDFVHKLGGVGSRAEVSDIISDFKVAAATDSQDAS